MSALPFGWFADENRQTLDHLIRKYQVRTVLEIGSFLGLSAVWFAQRCPYVTCIDKFEELEAVPTENNLVQTLQEMKLARSFYDEFWSNIVAAGVQERIHVVRGWSHLVANQVPSHDLVYIDGDHSFAGCYQDILLYREKAKEIICGDDYTARFPGVVAAVDQLLPKHCSRGPFWYNIQGVE